MINSYVWEHTRLIFTSVSLFALQMENLASFERNLLLERKYRCFFFVWLYFRINI
jgi:hypothetical protein